jgi:hypothetical protein
MPAQPAGRALLFDVDNFTIGAGLPVPSRDAPATQRGESQQADNAHCTDLDRARVQAVYRASTGISDTLTGLVSPANEAGMGLWPPREQVVSGRVWPVCRDGWIIDTKRLDSRSRHSYCAATGLGWSPRPTTTTVSPITSWLLTPGAESSGSGCDSFVTSSRRRSDLGRLPVSLGIGAADRTSVGSAASGWAWRRPGGGWYGS